MMSKKMKKRVWKLYLCGCGRGCPEYRRVLRGDSLRRQPYCYAKGELISEMADLKFYEQMDFPFPACCPLGDEKK
jgi:sulfatase maturation enzyme AslB (radical SAM superfamily)